MLYHVHNYLDSLLRPEDYIQPRHFLMTAPIETLQAVFKLHYEALARIELLKTGEPKFCVLAGMRGSPWRSYGVVVTPAQDVVG